MPPVPPKINTVDAMDLSFMRTTILTHTCWTPVRIAHGQDEEKSGSPAKNLRQLWPSFHMAQEMGESLGRGPLLLG